MKKVDVRQWLAPNTRGWLVKEVAARSTVDTIFDTAVTVGLYDRYSHCRNWGRGEAKEELTRLLSCPQKRKSQVWIASLSVREWARLVLSAKADISLAQDRLCQLDDNLELDEERWWDDLKTLMHQRDDLEGVYHLMLHRWGETEIASELLTLDARAEYFIQALPKWVPIEDARLDEAASLDLSTCLWWCGSPWRDGDHPCRWDEVW
jgi:hypothetical protein